MISPELRDEVERWIAEDPDTKTRNQLSEWLAAGDNKNLES